MAKFCTSCGTPYEENTRFCKKCGASLSAPVTTVPQQTEEVAPAQPTYTAPVCDTPDSAPEATDAPAKKPKKKLLLAAIALVLAAAITLTTVFVVLPIFRKGDGKGYTVAGKDYITFTSPDTRYYGSGVDYLDTSLDDQSMSLTKWGIGYALRYSPFRFASLEDCAYGVIESSDPYIGKITYEDPSKADTYIKEAMAENNLSATSIPLVTEWLTVEDMTDVDETLAEAIMRYSYEWQYVDGYIYFYIRPYVDVFEIFKEVAYTFGRINIEDKSIEIIGNNINVCDYVVYDDWVYFSDNGWNSDVVIEYDYKKAGLYKMRTDGSEVTKLLDFDCEDPDEYLHDGYAPFSELSVYDGKLYFIDNGDPWFGALKRMDLDGDDVEQVAENTTYEYTFDASSNTLYYVTGAVYVNNQTDVKEIYRVDLDDFDEELFADYALKQDRIQIACADSKLYFASINHGFGTHSKGNVYGSKDDPSFRGIYYDLEEEKATAAYCWHDVETITKEVIAGRYTTQTEYKNPHFYWEEYDPSTGPFTFYY